MRRRGAALLLAGAAALAWADPPAPPAPVLRLDDKAIRDAVKATVAEMPKLPAAGARPDFGGGATAPGAGGQAAIDRGFTAAEVGSCWGSDALKHNPPVIMVGGLPVVLGGLLALPHVFYAATSGKCK